MPIIGQVSFKSNRKTSPAVPQQFINKQAPAVQEHQPRPNPHNFTGGSYES